MPFDTYLYYCSSQHDEMPLYLFDRTFAVKAPQLAADYTVPQYFKDDLFGVLGEPDYSALIGHSTGGAAGGTADAVQGANGHDGGACEGLTMGGYGKEAAEGGRPDYRWVDGWAGEGVAACCRRDSARGSCAEWISDLPSALSLTLISIIVDQSL